MKLRRRSDVIEQEGEACYAARLRSTGEKRRRRVCVAQERCYAGAPA